MSTKDTIFALVTPLAKSGVAIIRISGPHANDALAALTDKPFAPNMAQAVALHAPSGEMLDRGLAIFFQGPKSFTGEDVVELHLHGSIAVIREMLELLSTFDGLRPAEPGEFTRRAFLNGKMDLVEAEGLADLIDAETPKQKAQALGQMQGSLSKYYEELRTRIIHVLAHLEAYIDFPEEEIPESVIANMAGDIAAIKSTIESALADHKSGERVREGFRVVILGAPNAGKSSLLNAIARRDAAIVSHRAGTTRDVIEVHMDIAGFPVILTDTAGLRESADDIEEEGVRRALQRAGDADLKLILFDGSLLPKLDPKSLALLDEDSILIINKSDILIRDVKNLSWNYKPILISTQTGEGMAALMETIEQRISFAFSSHHAPVITRHRHRALLQEALDGLNRFSPSRPLELTCEEIRCVAQSVGKITGKIQVDDILDVVFKQFCIGK